MRVLRLWRDRRRSPPRGWRVAPHIPRSACARKPEWVIDEVIRLKAHLPDAGCRRIALTFNRLHAARTKLTVSKSFVAVVVRRHRYQIAQLRQSWKQRIPPPSPINHTWGVDLTGKRDGMGEIHTILAVLDHGSRRVLSLQALRDKASTTLLRSLLYTIERFGKPRFVRTDNEAVFTSALFRFGLRLLGIRHQRTDVGCPWQNGRVERFFGTLKEKLNQWGVAHREMLNLALGDFAFWYNAVRPHQHLGGRTPVEVWTGIDPYRTVPSEVRYISKWDGLLTGYYLRR